MVMDDLCELQQLAARVAQYRPDPNYRDDALGLRCCELALQAAQTGNYGVGALLVDPAGHIICEASNQVFSPQFCSSAHAEMRLLDQFEASSTAHNPPDRLKLIVSLEPCAMCLSRIILSGIGVVKFLAEDNAGGMLTHRHHLPPAWRNLAETQDFYSAHVSPALRHLAAELAAVNLPALREQLYHARMGD